MRTNPFDEALAFLTGTSLVSLTDVLLAASFILGVVGKAFTFHLYLGLYRHPAEGPWLFFFLIFVQAYLVLHAAGRSLGLDAPGHSYRRIS